MFGQREIEGGNFKFIDHVTSSLICKNSNAPPWLPARTTPWRAPLKCKKPSMSLRLCQKKRWCDVSECVYSIPFEIGFESSDKIKSLWYRQRFQIYVTEIVFWHPYIININLFVCCALSAKVNFNFRQSRPDKWFFNAVRNVIGCQYKIKTSVHNFETSILDGI